MTSFADRIAALPEWPTEDKYVTPMMLKSGVQLTYSYPADEMRCLSDQLDAALARLALAREWIAAYPHQDCCPWRGVRHNMSGRSPSCDCGRDALLAALEEPK